MSHVVFHQPQRSLWFPYQFVTQGLLLALLIATGTPVNAQPTIPPTVGPSRQTSVTNAVINQLLGQWQIKDPTTEQVLTLIFTPQNQLFFILPGNDGSAIAIKTAYQVRATTQPMQLDMALTPDQTALTIFELTPQGKLRLELNGITPGQPRPSKFSPTVSLLEKVSDVTTVPQNIEILELESKTSQSRPNIPTQYITLLNRAQQAFHLEKGKFAADIDELGIATNLETESYRYQIVPVGDRTQSVAITAQPKDAGLPSYIGAVFVTEVEGDLITVAGICESDRPASSPPNMPTPPTGDSLEIQCPVGSRLLSGK